MLSISNVRPPICIWLVCTSIGNHEPSLRQPNASIGCFPVSTASDRASCSPGAMISPSGCPITSSSL